LLRSPLAALGFVGAFVSAPALAQQAGDYPPGCDESKVSRGDHDRAHPVFLSGKEFLEESNYDKAISYFIDAYSIDCSVHAMLPIIATAYERKGDEAEAPGRVLEARRMHRTTKSSNIAYWGCERPFLGVTRYESLHTVPVHRRLPERSTRYAKVGRKVSLRCAPEGGGDLTESLEGPADPYPGVTRRHYRGKGRRSRRRRPLCEVPNEPARN
jgi:hypothetical protein